MFSRLFLRLSYWKVKSTCIHHRFMSNCWNCAHNNNTKSYFFCEKCNSLLSPTTGSEEKFNHFQLFDITKTFRLDIIDLAKKYKRLQIQMHPDKYATKGEIEKKNAEEWSPIINDAYNVLLKPYKRSLYLLELSGNGVEESDITLESSFLIEIMELNEEVSEAEQNPDEIKKLSESNKKVLNDYVEKIQTAYDRNDFELAKELTVKLKYFSNVQDKLIELETKLGIF